MGSVSRRHFLVGGLGTVAGIAMLTACGRTQPPGSGGAGPATTSKDQQVTLRFMTNESDPPSQRVYDAAVAEFTAQNPNVKVNMEYIGADDRAEKLTTGIGAKRAPHISQMVPPEVLEYARLGYLAQVDDLVTETGGPSKWQPTSLDGAMVEGKAYALPYNGGNYRTLWYRTDLFEQAGLKPPTNWNEWKQAAEALTKDANGDGNPDQFGLALPGGKNRWTLGNYMRFLWQTGETVFDKDFNVIFGKEGAVRALEYYRDMLKFGPPGHASYSYNETQDAFVSGLAATQPYAGRTLGKVHDNAPQLLNVTRGAKLPAGPIGGEVGFAGWDMYAIFNEKVGVSTAEQDAAKKFLKHILTGKPATDFALTVPGHLIPPYLETLEDPNLWTGHPLMTSHKAEIEWLYVTRNSLDYITEAGATITADKVTPGPVNPYWQAVDSGMIIPTMVQKVVIQNEAPKAAVEWAASEMKRVVEDAKKKKR